MKVLMIHVGNEVKNSPSLGPEYYFQRKGLLDGQMKIYFTIYTERGDKPGTSRKLALAITHKKRPTTESTPFTVVAAN